MAYLVLKDMQITGGTDIDWLVERNGDFIIVESKEFRNDTISIPWGQMRAYQSLHEKLSVDGKCYFYFFASDEDTDFKNPESPIWYFRMVQWKRGEIPHTTIDDRAIRHIIKKSDMIKIPIKHFRVLMESHWNEFKRNKKPKTSNNHLSDKDFGNYLKNALSDLKVQHDFHLDENTQRKKAYSYEEIRKMYPKAYERWTEYDDEFLKKFWKDESNKQSRNEKIRELMQKFGRNRGAIVSRLNKMGFDLENKKSM